MNREMRRLMEREERREKSKDAANGDRRPGRRPPAASRPQAERKPLIERLGRFLHDVRQELSRVSWPTRDQMVAFTTVTLITTVALTLVVFGLDVGMKELVLLVVEQRS